MRRGPVAIGLVLCACVGAIAYVRMARHHPHRLSEEERVQRQTRCMACLEDGSDYCIRSNRCTERATFTCDRREDHITGDESFARLGHATECPLAETRAFVPRQEDSSELAGYQADVSAGFAEMSRLVTHRTRAREPDCYFDEACHALVDWQMVKEMKLRFFSALKRMKQDGSRTGVQGLMDRMHNGFLKAGMPEDRIAYILDKWVNYVYPEVAQDDPCNKYKSWGPMAMKGCQGCKKLQEEKGISVDKCMGCGAKCYASACHSSSDPGACVNSDAFKSCDRECLFKDTENDPCDKYKSWGPMAWKGCQGCKKLQKEKGISVDKCMDCGKKCYLKACQDSPFPAQCMAGKEWKDCDSECLSGDDPCAKYEAWGPVAMQGCQKCKLLESKGITVDTCMDCGSKCWKKFCRDLDDPSECVKNEKFLACDKKCLAWRRRSVKGKEHVDGCEKYKSWGKQAMQGCHGCKKLEEEKGISIDKCMGCGKFCYAKACDGSADTGACVNSDAFKSCDKECLQDEADVCSAYKSWGPFAQKGCEGCQILEQQKGIAVAECMGCERSCWQKQCVGQGQRCAWQPKYKACVADCVSLRAPRSGRARVLV